MASGDAPAQHEDIEPEDDTIYEVQEILAMEVVNGKKFYYIKWEGYPDSYNSWEPENLMECPDKIKEFDEKMAKQASKSAAGQSPSVSSSQSKKKKPVTTRGRPKKQAPKKTEASTSQTSSKRRGSSASQEVSSSQQPTTPKSSASAAVTSPDEEVEMIELCKEPKQGNEIAILKFKTKGKSLEMFKYLPYDYVKDTYPIAVIDFLEKNMEFKGIIPGIPFRLTEVRE